MNSEWQWIVVGVIVFACAMDVARRVWHSVRHLGQSEGGCSSCSSCPTSNSPAVVTIARPEQSSTADALAPEHSE